MDDKITVATKGRTIHGAIRAWDSPVVSCQDGFDRLVVFDATTGSDNLVEITIHGVSVWVEIDNLKRVVECL